MEPQEKNQNKSAVDPSTPSEPPKAAVGRTRKAYSVKKGEGRFHGHLEQQKANANTLDVKVSGTDTGGNLALFDLTTRSLKQGPPLHVHHHQDETFVVQEGEFILETGGETMRLAVGDTVFLPKGVPHVWAQLTELARMTIILQPAGGFEDYFVALAAMKDPTQEQITQLFEAYGMSIVGPPLAFD